MKRCFKVKMILNDNVDNVYYIIAETDIRAREIAEDLEIKAYRQAHEKFSGIDYCEITFAHNIDA